MRLALWYIGCLVLGLAAGSHSGFYGGLGLLVIGIPVYFMSPPRFRAVISELHLVAGAALLFLASIAFYPLVGALGLV